MRKLRAKKEHCVACARQCAKKEALEKNRVLRPAGGRSGAAYTTPWASMASATLTKPAMLAPSM